MKKNSLLATNIHLKDHTTRDKLLRKTVLSSCAVEGIGKSGERALAAMSTVTPPQPDEASPVPRP